MKKTMGMMMGVVMMIFAGCAAPSIPESVVGEWQLETVSTAEEGVLIAGNAYWGDETDKTDATLTFDEDGTFTSLGFDDELNGTSAKAKSTVDAMAIAMTFSDKSKVTAVYGIRYYQQDIKAPSLIFEYQDKIYSFLKMR